MALPQPKKVVIPEIKKEDKLIEVQKKEIDKVLDVEKKLVEKEEKTRNKMNPLELKDLEKKKDDTLKDLMKLTKGDMSKIKDLMEQEKHIVDKKELDRATAADPLKFDEVGEKKADNVKDIIAAEKGQQDHVKDLTAKDLISEKEPPKKNAIISDNLGIKLKDESDKPIKEIQATKEERELARKYLALQEQETIIDKTPAKNSQPQAILRRG